MTDKLLKTLYWTQGTMIVLFVVASAAFVLNKKPSDVYDVATQNSKGLASVQGQISELRAELNVKSDVLRLKEELLAAEAKILKLEADVERLKGK